MHTLSDQVLTFTAATPQSLARPTGDSSFSYRWLGCLSPPSGSATPCGRQAEDPTARTEPSHPAHADQTVSAENYLLFQIPRHARDRHGAVQQPVRVRPADVN